MSSCGLAALGWPYLVVAWREKKQLLAIAVAASMVALWLVAALWGGRMAFGHWRPFDDQRKVMWSMILTNRPDSYPYLPRTAPVRSLDGHEKMTAFARQHPPKQISAQDTGGAALPAPALTSWKPREILLRHTGAAGMVTVNHFYYPHWRAYRTDAGPLEIKANAIGMMQVAAPAGDYDIRIVLEKSPAEMAGDSATVAGLLVVGGLWLNGRRKRA